MEYFEELSSNISEFIKFTICQIFLGERSLNPPPPPPPTKPVVAKITKLHHFSKISYGSAIYIINIIEHFLGLNIIQIPVCSKTTHQITQLFKILSMDIRHDPKPHKMQAGTQ